ncbi:MAG TPA: R3H domain-containing nucleic acid-binding protein [Nevskiaceae bacterium]|nr:R3H domain-containing nucleic acid-binding protein [Nevskiaceae bacterium]
MVKKTKKKVKKPDKLQTTKELTEKLLDLLGLSIRFEINEKEDVININLETDNPALLIGYHGETLASFQFILSIMTYRKLGEWVRIMVDVADYRQRRQKTLERMALSVAQRVKFSGEQQPLPPMSPLERRIIHLALANQPEVETVSEGEGHERRVVIKPKKI